jgi:hypothetical protein
MIKRKRSSSSAVKQRPQGGPSPRYEAPRGPARKSPREVELPEHLPARMLNEFTYCPRLFYYEWVEGLFAHNLDTIEGAQRHEKIDGKTDPLPVPDDRAERFHARSVELTCDTLGIIARIDIVEGSGEYATPVDYKRGAPRDTPEGPEPWPRGSHPGRRPGARASCQRLLLRRGGALLRPHAAEGARPDR